MSGSSRQLMKLTTDDPQERSTWRSGVRSAMCAASQLPGRGPTDVDDMPLHLHVNQKSDYDDDINSDDKVVQTLGNNCWRQTKTLSMSLKVGSRHLRPRSAKPF